MRSFKSMKQAVQALAVDYETKVTPMLIKASSNEIFKNPVNESQYSPHWLKHHIYEHPNLKIFKMFLTVYPPLYDFRVQGYDEDFLAKKD